MIKTTLRLAALGSLAALTALVAVGLPDLRRYIGISRLSGNPGHPESVPVAGRVAYPQAASAAAPDGTGDFDSATRGGPR